MMGRMIAIRGNDCYDRIWSLEISKKFCGRLVGCVCLILLDTRRFCFRFDGSYLQHWSCEGFWILKSIAGLDLVEILLFYMNDN
jgi:hypothetical protein